MISLSKNQSVSLTKTASTSLGNIDIGLGWDPIKKKGFFGFGGSSEIDLDASCVLLDVNGKEKEIIWFGNLKSKCNSVVHNGDNRTGEGDGDDEVISVNLDKLPADIEYIAITVNSFRGQTFNDVENAFCRIVNKNDNKELVNFKLAEQGAHTGILIASLARKSGDWTFSAHGKACNGSTVKDMLPAITSTIVG